MTLHPVTEFTIDLATDTARNLGAIVAADPSGDAVIKVNGHDLIIYSRAGLIEAAGEELFNELAVPWRGVFLSREDLHVCDFCGDVILPDADTCEFDDGTIHQACEKDAIDYRDNDIERDERKAWQASQL